MNTKAQKLVNDIHLLFTTMDEFHKKHAESGGFLDEHHDDTVHEFGEVAFVLLGDALAIFEGGES